MQHTKSDISVSEVTSVGHSSEAKYCNEEYQLCGMWWAINASNLYSH